MNWLLSLFLVLLVLNVFKSLFLDLLNRRNIRKNSGEVPEAFGQVMDKSTYQRSVAYSLEKNRLGMITAVFDALVLALVICLEFLPFLWVEWGGFFGQSIWSGAAYLVAVTFMLGLPNLPFDWYDTFKLEERYGFNKSSIGLWISDKAKGVLIGLAIGFPMICLLLKMVDWMGRFWWLWGFVAVLLFQLLMIVLYPKLILPLFNKLEPLEEGELKTSLMELADRAGFAARTIEIMDGSKRSGHSNAFFTGFGRFRRIVLYDTLMEQLEAGELKAVLAHEIGHYKLGHFPKRIALSAIGLFVAFGCIAYLAESNWFYQGFGFETTSIAPAFLLVALLSGLITSWLTPLFSMLSRKHEYEADAFAKKALGEPLSLVGALRKLNQKNLSNLTPHPLYSAFYYSHPTLLEREKALLATS